MELYWGKKKADFDDVILNNPNYSLEFDRKHKKQSDSELTTVSSLRNCDEFCLNGKVINFSDLEKFLEEEDPLNGGTTLEMLIEARKIIMPTWDQNNQASIKAWEDISSEYGTCASGTVTGVIGKNLRPGNIWENRELPALKNNPNITKIVIIDPKTKISTVIFQR